MWAKLRKRQTQENRRSTPRGSPRGVSKSAFEELLTASELLSKAETGLTALLSDLSPASPAILETLRMPTGKRSSTSPEIVAPDLVTPRRSVTSPLHLIRTGPRRSGDGTF